MQRRVGDREGWEATLTKLGNASEQSRVFFACGALMIVANELALDGDAKRYETAMDRSLDALTRNAKRLSEGQLTSLLIQHADAMANAGEDERALKLAESLGNDSIWRREALACVALSLAKRGKHEMVLKLASLPSLCGVLCEAVRVQVQAGHLDVARETALVLASRVAAANHGVPRWFLGETYCARAFLLIGDAKAKNGDLSGAREAFAEAVEAVRDTKVDITGIANLGRADKDFKRETEDLATIAEAYAASGNLAKYRSVIADAERALRATQDSQNRKAPLRTVACARIRAGDYRQAVALADRETFPANQAAAFVAIVRAWTEHKPTATQVGEPVR